jgi:flavin prenyltransferase
MNVPDSGLKAIKNCAIFDFLSYILRYEGFLKHQKPDFGGFLGIACLVSGEGDARFLWSPTRLASILWYSSAAARNDKRTGSFSMNSSPRRLIVGITGASGAIYGVRLLRLLQPTDIETHLVISRSARIALTQELDINIADVTALADVAHQIDNIGASISSGSFRTLGMVVAPCSMRSLSEIATGVTSSLLSRAADVVLKERRRLVLMVREAPLHLGHLRSMTAATEMGAIVYPPVPAFYARPESLEQMVDHTLGRVLDLFDIETSAVSRWGGLNSIKNSES